MAGFGGVIRDKKGCIKDIFHSHLGTSTNNMEELMALKQCLEILIESNLHNAIIEADSELVIKAAKKIVMERHQGKYRNIGGYHNSFSVFIPSCEP